MPAVVLPPLVQHRSPNQSGRRGAAVEHVCIHETAGSYAGAVSWLCTPTAYWPDGRVKSGPDASAHLVLREDGGECSQLVPLSAKAWTQGRWNPSCVSIELANITAKGYASDRQLQVAARIAGWLCKRYNLPPRWARHGVGRGLVFHGDLPDSGGHPNCGPDAFGWHRFVELVGDEIARGGYKREWAKT